MEWVENKFSERLRGLRKEQGLTIKETASRLNISFSALSNYEMGNRSPDFNTLIKLANFYKVTTDYLLGISNIKNIYLEQNDDIFKGGYFLFEEYNQIYTEYINTIFSVTKNTIKHSVGFDRDITPRLLILLDVYRTLEPFFEGLRLDEYDYNSHTVVSLFTKQKVMLDDHLNKLLMYYLSDLDNTIKELEEENDKLKLSENYL